MAVPGLLGKVGKAAGKALGRDAEYMAAVQAGDMAKAQRLVDEAAKEAGATVVSTQPDQFLNPSNIEPYHGLNVSKNASSIFWGTEPAANRDTLASLVRSFRNDKFFGPPVLVVGSSGSGGSLQAITGTHRLWSARRAGSEIPVINLSDRASDPEEFEEALSNVVHYEELEDIIRKYVGDEEANLFSHDIGETVKSSNPVTYDQQGNIIPLSQRFNPQSSNINYAAPATAVGAGGLLAAMTPDRAAQAAMAGQMSPAELMRQTGGFMQASQALRQAEQNRLMPAMRGEMSGPQTAIQRGAFDVGMAADRMGLGGTSGAYMNVAQGARPGLIDAILSGVELYDPIGSTQLGQGLLSR